MKSRDILEMEKATIVNKMNAAIESGDTEAFSSSFVELCQKIERSVLEQAEEMLAGQDTAILAQRGVRQLTRKEKEYYEKVIEAMRSGNPKQALNDVEVVMPETIMDSVFEDLTTSHPLLSKLSATTVTGLVRMMMNKNGEQMAAWGKLTGKIVEELTSGFEEVDVTQYKLSAFLPVSKPMLDLGPIWLDRYVRLVLAEALANGLEYAVIRGTGKDMPIGMMMQVGEGVTVSNGEHPMKESIKITSMDMRQLGNVTALIAKNGKGQSREVKDLIMVINPVDYWNRFLPATRVMTPNGSWVSALPVPAEEIQSAAVPEGKIVYGIAGKYFLGVGMAKNGKIEYSDDYHFLEDERVYLIKLYANGFAKDNNAFQVLDIEDLKPICFRVVSVDDTPTYNAKLADLKIGALALSPVFEPGTTTYTAKTSNATDVITATPESASAQIEITVGNAQVSNGSVAKWTDGSNVVKIDVTDGTESKSYQVTVTKDGD